jgi:hypothetical protein
MVRHVGRQQQAAHCLWQQRHMLQVWHGTAGQKHTPAFLFSTPTRCVAQHLHPQNRHNGTHHDVERLCVTNVGLTFDVGLSDVLDTERQWRVL